MGSHPWFLFIGFFFLFKVASVFKTNISDNHPLWESKCPHVIHVNSGYEIFVKVMKGYRIIGLVKTQGGTLY
jgi:hypothetical protein